MAPRSRVMVVDDEFLQRRALCKLLSAHGYRSYTASSGAEALALIPVLRPDLCLVDIMMPEMDGITFWKRMREDAATALIPVRLITGILAPPALLDAAAQGLDGGTIYCKGGDPAELLRLVAHAVSSRGSSVVENSGRFLRRGLVVVDVESRRVWIAERLVPHLPVRRFDLLCALLRSATAIDRREILRRVWPDSDSLNVVDVSIRRLRLDLQHFPEARILTMPTGYLLACDGRVLSIAA